MISLALSWFFLSVIANETAVAKSCPPLGPVVPPPRHNLSSDTTIQQAATLLKSNLTSLFAQPNITEQGADNTTSVSIQMVSLHDTNPLFEFYHTAPLINATGTQSVNSQTQFRIGSVTKAFTVLSLLKHENLFDWRSPITHYVPELLDNESGKNPVERVSWESVTLEALASQQGGIPRDIQDLATQYQLPWAALGFPQLNNTDLPPCGVATNLLPCDVAQYIKYLRVRQPAYAPYTTPVYSNAAYALLGLALERILHKEYATIVQDEIFKPLEMGDSSVAAPNASRVVIPVGDSQWNLDNSAESPSGQLYVSTGDMAKFAKGILGSKLLSPEQTRRWLKPSTHTASLTMSVGSPWEIIRSNELSSDGRVLDLFTKNGGIGEYGCYLVLVPDYEIALSIMVAGSSSPLTQMVELVLKSMVPAVDIVARTEAQKRYTAIYTNGNSNMTVSMTSDAGLKVDKWYNDGRDILQEYASIFQPVELSLYPTGLSSLNSNNTDAMAVMNNKCKYEESFRGVYNFINYPYDNFFDQCAAWEGIDGNVYGQQALDEFIFCGNDEGHIISVENSALRTVMYKS